MIEFKETIGDDYNNWQSIFQSISTVAYRILGRNVHGVVTDAHGPDGWARLGSKVLWLSVLRRHMSRGG